ncbi:hypothetical protein KIW84_UN0885 [Lathyrus oleraceus]|nr:hypothetical protein KIW84_UN0885 [Pisum sativum]
MKTRIDEKGREVTEVVWEGEETEPKKADTDAAKKADTGAAKKADYKASTNAINSAPATKKPPTTSNATGKEARKQETQRIRSRAIFFHFLRKYKTNFPKSYSIQGAIFLVIAWVLYYADLVLF